MQPSEKIVIEFTVSMQFVTVDCIKIHWNPDVEIEYYVEKYSILTLKAVAQNLYFYLNYNLSNLQEMNFTLLRISFRSLSHDDPKSLFFTTK